jgi:hypothetical protein
MTDAQRQTATKELSKAIRNVLDWRKGDPILRDEDAVIEAISDALGQQRLRKMLDWYAGGKKEADYWASVDVFETNCEEEKDDEDDDDCDF